MENLIELLKICWAFSAALIVAVFFAGLNIYEWLKTLSRKSADCPVGKLLGGGGDGRS